MVQALCAADVLGDTEYIPLQVDEVVLNGPGDLEGPDRYVGNLNLSFAYVEGESLIMGLKVDPSCCIYAYKVFPLEEQALAVRGFTCLCGLRSTHWQYAGAATC